MNKLLLTKLKERKILARIFLERLSEPLHLNVISLFIFIFGSIRNRIAFDLIVLQHHSFCLLNAADRAILEGTKKVTVIEFGVANGTGLVNICQVARIVTKATGIEFDIYMGLTVGKVCHRHATTGIIRSTISLVTFR
jgi:hypothetical protein